MNPDGTWGTSFGTWTTSTTWGDQVEWLPSGGGQWESMSIVKEVPAVPVSGLTRVLVTAYRDPMRHGIRMLGATEMVETAPGMGGCQVLLRMDDETRQEWYVNTEQADSALLAYASAWCSTGYEEVGMEEVALRWTGSMDDRWVSNVFLMAGSRILGRL